MITDISKEGLNKWAEGMRYKIRLQIIKFQLAEINRIKVEETLKAFEWGVYIYNT